MHNSFISKHIPPPHIPDNSLWFIFNGNQILLNLENKLSVIPTSKIISKLQPDLQLTHYLGELNGVHCFCSAINSHVTLQNPWKFEVLKYAHVLLSETLFKIATRALQVLYWDKTHQFCSCCGEKINIKTDERTKYCAKCDLFFYPRLSPAVIVVVERGKEILLARSPHFPPEIFGILAGFVEPGETAEETVAREVMEEVSIQVKDIRYMGSQHWPFPDSFMLGFTAQYAAGEIVVDGKEIEAAGWYTIDNLPKLPNSASIAKRLIDQFIERHK